jgi:hypothetical protein
MEINDEPRLIKENRCMVSQMGSHSDHIGKCHPVGSRRVPPLKTPAQRSAFLALGRPTACDGESSVPAGALVGRRSASLIFLLLYRAALAFCIANFRSKLEPNYR